MRYLLDTNIFLWWLDDDKRLKDSIQKIIKNKENQIFVSVVSGWEISIKHHAGKLPIKTTIKTMFDVAGFKIVDIILSHILELDKLPVYKGHKDPFDRILISQAKVENLKLITSDQKIWKYQIPVIKA